MRFWRSSCAYCFCSTISDHLVGLLLKTYKAHFVIVEICDICFRYCLGFDRFVLMYLLYCFLASLFG